MNLKQYCCFLSDEGQSKIQIARKKNNRDYPWEMYTLKELLRATNNFHQDNKIGEGGFGSIAVKRLKTMTAKAEMEFAVEVEVLGRECQLDWARRMSIAIGAAEDPKLKGRFDLQQLKNVTTIALRCTDTSADKRPNMKEVVNWLKNGVGST
ncbi:Receptor-like serine/threonine-protein [Vigna angularis]|uniref:Receptor-like serine/threonine-protein n=1 Tax=Phaseolus angularis TaxID=3914 RepID=A0A8T0JWC4_PHAAN|nr:Receptor-like serine/threonine-protein [Vigna angularis]